MGNSFMLKPGLSSGEQGIQPVATSVEKEVPKEGIESWTQILENGNTRILDEDFANIDSGGEKYKEVKDLASQMLDPGEKSRLFKVICTLSSVALMLGLVSPVKGDENKMFSEALKSRSPQSTLMNPDSNEWNREGTDGILGSRSQQAIFLSPNYTEVNLEEIEEEVENKETIQKLDLTQEWSSKEKSLKLEDGKGEVEISLFLDKGSEYNYGKGEGPDGNSRLVWNATEAVHRFGEITLKPGDERSFAREVDFIIPVPSMSLFNDREARKVVEEEKNLFNYHVEFERLIGRRNPERNNFREFNDWVEQNEPEDYVSTIHHGDGYVEGGGGACFAATVFGEALGLSIRNEKGEVIPLFRTEISGVQGHTMDSGGYYKYLYHGPGVAINSSSYGQLWFTLNPELPDGVKVKIEMGIKETNPSQVEKGMFSPTVTLKVSGFPEGWNTLESLRLTANRKKVLEAISGRSW